MTGGYWLLNKNTTPPAAKVSPGNTSQDALPGKNKAVLVLADGTKIVIDSASMGLLASQGKAQVVYKDGKVMYETLQAKDNTLPLFNTLSTVNGESFSLTLSDGTRLWLNAASSARFPVTFNGPERKVEITGEVYFEVAKIKQSPLLYRPMVWKCRHWEQLSMSTHI
ncbi:FecR family protein [Paraflavitalea speifideaquila]|uniref:FecR family protein n=1 Tax=Paraflavitalea speifideaquila TaxID=3076558 RepID=UPI0028E24C47|nr:FecR family protein [Paraflavitalea speifideiaquila]